MTLVERVQNWAGVREDSLGSPPPNRVGRHPCTKRSSSATWPDARTAPTVAGTAFTNFWLRVADRSGESSRILLKGRLQTHSGSDESRNPFRCTQVVATGMPIPGGPALGTEARKIPALEVLEETLAREPGIYSGWEG